MSIQGQDTRNPLPVSEPKESTSDVQRTEVLPSSGVSDVTSAIQEHSAPASNVIGLLLYITL